MLLDDLGITPAQETMIYVGIAAYVAMVALVVGEPPPRKPPKRNDVDTSHDD